MLKASNLNPHQVFELKTHRLIIICERKHKDAGNIAKLYIKEVETHTLLISHKMFIFLFF